MVYLWLGCRQKNEGTLLVEFNDQIACAWMKILDRMCVCVLSFCVCVCIQAVVKLNSWRYCCDLCRRQLEHACRWPVAHQTCSIHGAGRSLWSSLFMCNARRKLGRLRMTQFWSIRLCLVARPCIDMKLLSTINKSLLIETLISYQGV